MLFVRHVANQNDYHVWLGLNPSFLQPKLKINESTDSSHIIAQHNAVSVSVEHLCDCFKCLLPSSVPNLELKHFILELAV